MAVSKSQVDFTSKKTSWRKTRFFILATGLGIEPRFTASKAAVLPLYDPVMSIKYLKNQDYSSKKTSLVPITSEASVKNYCHRPVIVLITGAVRTIPTTTWFDNLALKTWIALTLGLKVNF